MITYTLLLITLALLNIDWLQTRYIATHPYEYSEINIILGRHPTSAKVNWYFGICSVLVAGISLYTNDLFAWLFLGVISIMELICVVHNYRNGIVILETKSLVEFCRQWKITFVVVTVCILGFVIIGLLP